MAVGVYACYTLMTAFPDINIAFHIIAAGVVTAGVGFSSACRPCASRGSTSPSPRSRRSSFWSGSSTGCHGSTTTLPRARSARPSARSSASPLPGRRPRVRGRPHRDPRRTNAPQEGPCGESVKPCGCRHEANVRALRLCSSGGEASCCHAAFAWQETEPLRVLEPVPAELQGIALPRRPGARRTRSQSIGR